MHLSAMAMGSSDRLGSSNVSVRPLPGKDAGAAREGEEPANFQIVKAPGISNNPHGVERNWELETTLDVEWSHAIAPGANIALVLATDHRTAELQDNPPASMIYITGLEAVTFLEVIPSGYVHESTIFQPYLKNKKGYSCIYPRYSAGSHDAMAERYVGVARPLTVGTGAQVISYVVFLGDSQRGKIPFSRLPRFDQAGDGPFVPVTEIVVSSL
jgi:hypothetical protein